jgi:hypothetical protein
MLIMSVGTRSAATGRIVETFIGTAAGLVAGFVLTSPRVQPAEEAIQELCDTMADLLDRTYGSLATEFDAPRHDLLESELERHLAAAHDEQDRLSELLRTDPVARPVGWPLRGELISHLDRFRTELEAGKPDSRPRRRRNRAWRLPHARLQRLPPAWRRLIK